MTRTDDLEAELRASWSEGTLAVYADHLIHMGDPRGELIALERKDDPESRQRRGELVRGLVADLGFSTWLAEDGTTWCAGSPTERTTLAFEHGLIEAFHISTDDDPDAAALIAFIDHPISRFVHRLSIQAVDLVHRIALGRLALRPRLWLRSLALHREGETADLMMGDVTDLVAATPNLVQVELAGRRLMRRLDHAGIHELVLTGHDALQSPGWAMPGVTTLDLASLQRPTLTTAQFPALRRLLLGRNEPGEQVFVALRDLEVAEQLVRLELPSLRSDRDVANVQAALDQMSGLREVHIAQAYMCFGDLAHRLRHANARVTAAPQWPWPPRDELAGNELCVIDDQVCSLVTLIEILEDQHDELDAAGQAFWFRWWGALRTSQRVSFRASELYAALEPLSLGDVAWGAVRERLCTAGDRFIDLRPA